MQQTRLPTIKEPSIPKPIEKERRFLHPSPFKYNGRRLFSNALGQQFFARTRLDGKPSNYSIDVFQLGDGEPITRFSAALALYGKALIIKFMSRESGGDFGRYHKMAPGGYCASRIIVNEAISLAQKLGAESIYMENVGYIQLFAHFRSLGFKEVEGTNHMWLEVPGGARNP